MRRHENIVVRISLLAAALFAVVTGPAMAADALAICNSGQPFLWPAGGVGIPFNPDQGDLYDGVIDNPTGVALVQASFDNWTAGGPYAVPTTATYVNAGPLPIDVDITNFLEWLFPAAPDGYSAIVFDATGEIFVDIFGPGSGILGFAGPEWINFVSCDILEGVSFLNGPEFTNLTAAEDVMTHEFGHYTNLGHVELNGQLGSVVTPNGQEADDDSGPTPDSTTFPVPASLAGLIETMYPFYYGPAAGTLSPHADDVASIATLYPSADFYSTYGSISGTIYAPNETTRLSGVNVIARNLADPFADAVSTFSGAYTDSTSQADPNVGIYVLNGLTPGAEYAVFVDQVSAFPTRFSNPVIALPGPEEYWNADESSSDPPDDPLVFDPITAEAGSPIAGTDIIFNAPKPGDPLRLGEDGFVQLALPFVYSICGQDFDSVFVNANGNVTFGSGDTDYTESAGEMLSDQPRIAALWDDLSPYNFFTGAQQGLVTFDYTRNTFTVIFEDVPEFENTGANSFEITLYKSSDAIDIVYGDITAADGIAGVSCGGAITSGFETEGDLTALQDAAYPGRINLQRQPAVYEDFDADNDLAYQMLLFNGTHDYNDNWAEPNDSLRAARRIRLPFDSSRITRFTEIEPAGGDVDYYLFRVHGGQTLIAEIVTGELDSLIGLFDRAGNLVAADDDGGAGLLSKIQYPIFETGYYYLAVTTYADFDFDGNGNSGGRYVVSLDTIEGLQLALGDDDSEEVPLGFTFPFQGFDYTSVFVNSNGSLTFGGGDTDFSESVSEFLGEQPRIAPLWVDLSPNNGGAVSFEFGAGTFTVSFDGVPEWPATGSNTFAVTLDADGSYAIAYGAVSATDGLVGTTEGFGVLDPGASDLSGGGPYSRAGTTYELFDGGNPFDLTGATLIFN